MCTHTATQEPVNYKVPGTAHPYRFPILLDFLALRCIELSYHVYGLQIPSCDHIILRFLYSEELLFIYGFMFVSEGQFSLNCSLNSVFLNLPTS